MLKIYPSLLAVHDKVGNDIPALAAAAQHGFNAGGAALHLDFMAPPFTDRVTFSTIIIKDLRRAGVKGALDVHLMTPLSWVQQLPLAELYSLTFHAKMARGSDEIPVLLAYLQKNGVQGGLAIDADEAVAPLAPLLALPACQQVLLMTVPAGAGGQAIRPDLLTKVAEIRALRPDLPITVDGGVNVYTIKQVAAAGANAAVAGSAVFNEQDIENNMNNLWLAAG